MNTSNFIVNYRFLWENRFRSDRRKTCKVMVNTTDCPIQEPKGTDISKKGQLYPFNPKWCSQKFKGAGLRYKIAVNIQTGDIVRLNSPFPWSCGKSVIFPHLVGFHSSRQNIY